MFLWMELVVLYCMHVYRPYLNKSSSYTAKTMVCKGSFGMHAHMHVHFCNSGHKKHAGHGIVYIIIIYHCKNTRFMLVPTWLNEVCKKCTCTQTYPSFWINTMSLMLSLRWQQHINLILGVWLGLCADILLFHTSLNQVATGQKNLK